MKKDYSNKLKNYTALASSVLIVAGTVDGQIIYTDVTPDPIISGQGSLYQLNLDNAGIAEFQFLTLNYTPSSHPLNHYNIIGLAPNVGNAVYAATFASGTSTFLPYAMNQGQLIGPNSHWQTNSSIQIMAFSVYSDGSPAAQGGYFLGTTDKYLGLQFQLGGQTHYGWARVDVNADASTLTLKDYAYDATADNPILAGNIGVGINELTSQNLQVFAANNQIIIRFANGQAPLGMLHLVNVLGQEILNQEIESVMHISVNNLPTGTYFLEFKEPNGQIVNRKVFITKD